MLRFSRTAFAISCVAVCSLGIPGGAVADDWLDSDWSHRVKLTARSELLPGGGVALSDFTALVRVEEQNLSAVFDTAKPDGSDLVFTSDDGLTTLGHELVSYDPVAREAEIWFKADELSSSSASNVFYLYFGNPDTTLTQAVGAGWTNDHLAVYHFAENPSTEVVLDSGPGNGDNPALPGEGSNWKNDDFVTGKVGGAWYFDGVENWLFAPSITSPDTSFTISAWYANTDDVEKVMVAMNPLSGYWALDFRRSILDPNAGLETGDNGSMTWLPDVTDTEMHHYAWSLDAVADTARFYWDGVEQAVNGSFVPPGSDGPIYAGQSVDGRVGIASPVFGASTDLTQGIVDEYRIVQGVRAADWIATEFANQNDPVEFFTYQIQAQDDPPTSVDSFIPGSNLGRISVWPNPVRGVATINVDMNSPHIEVMVYDVAGRLVRGFGGRSGVEGPLTLQWNGRDDAGTRVGRGVYYVRAIGDRGTLGTKVLLVR